MPVWFDPKMQGEKFPEAGGEDAAAIFYLVERDREPVAEPDPATKSCRVRCRARVSGLLNLAFGQKGKQSPLRSC